MGDVFDQAAPSDVFDAASGDIFDQAEHEHQQASASLESVTRPQSAPPAAPSSARYSLGPTPQTRSVAEGLTTEQQERRGGMPLVLRPPTGGLGIPQPRRIAPVGLPTQPLSAPVKAENPIPAYEGAERGPSNVSNYEHRDIAARKQAEDVATRDIGQNYESTLEMGRKAGQRVGGGVAAMVTSPLQGHPQGIGEVFGDEFQQSYAKDHPATMGISRAVGGFAGQMASDPVTYLFAGTSEIATPVLNKIISVGFRGGLAIGALGVARDLQKNWDKYTPAERYEKATEAGLSAALAAGAEHVKSFLSKPYEPFPQEADAKIEALFRNQTYRAGADPIPQNATFEQANKAFRRAAANIHSDTGSSSTEIGNLTDTWNRYKAARGWGKSGGAAGTPTPTPTRAEIAEHMDRTDFQGPEATKASLEAEKQAQTEAAKPEVIPPAKPSVTQSYESAKAFAEKFLDEHGRLSPSVLQRNLKMGYANAMTVLGRMANEGVIQTDSNGTIFTRVPSSQPIVLDQSQVEETKLPAFQEESPETTAKRLQDEGRLATDVDKWQPPKELGAFPDTPDVGKKARNDNPEPTRAEVKGPERRAVDRSGQQEEDRLFGQARKELGEGATSEQIMARVAELRPREAKAEEAAGAVQPAGEKSGTAAAKNQPAGNTETESSAKADLTKGSPVTLADGRRGKIEYSSPSDKLPIVRIKTDDGETVKLTRQSDIDKLTAGTKYKHGNTQANIPEGSEAHTALEAARSRISDSDLAGKGKDVDGNHVTVRYGIKGDDTEGIKKYLASLSPFEASLGKTEKFPPSESSDGAAVIHAPIESPELQKINAEIEKHGEFAPSNFDSYKPHASIAYVKPEQAHRYIKMHITDGKKFPVNEIAITDRNGKQTIVKLEGNKSNLSPTLPAYAREEIERQNAFAEKLGLADKIEELSAQGLVAKQITARLEFPEDMDAMDRSGMVRSVRAVRGIPSQDDPKEFESWKKSREGKGANVTKPVERPSGSTDLAPKTGGDGKHYVHLSGEGAPTMNVRVDSADQASAAVQLYRDKYDLGSSTMGEGAGAIFDPGGKQIGHVSYNGRVWPGTAQEWKSGTKPLQEAYDFGKQKMLAERPSGSAPVPPKKTETETSGDFKKGEFVYHEGRRVKVEGSHTLIAVPLRAGGARTETTMVEVRDQQGGIHTVRSTDLAREPQALKAPRPVTPQIVPEKKPAAGPTLKEGDRVSWEGQRGSKLSGTIESIDTQRGTASINTDQIINLGGRMPIGRIETVKLERLQWEGSPEQKPAEPAAGEKKPVDTGRTLEQEKQGGKAEDKPARVPGGPKEVSGVSGSPVEGGAARTPVPSAGSRSPEGEREAGRGTGQPDRGSLERAGGSEGEGSQPARSGGSRTPKHTPAERTGGGASPTGSTGADGRRIEAPTPEEPEEARTTAAELRNQRNYKISDEDATSIGAGGEKSKIRGNLDALETFKKIQAEGRELATPEEQAAIAKYVDFGGLVGMLQNPYASEYREHTERFNKILTEAERQEIRETLPNTHYTSMQMVDWAWKALGRLGFKGGRWLEPGMGIGNFVGRMPEKIGNRSEVYGVERNPLTGGMAKLLYPDAKIQVKPFQQFIVPNNSFDAAIGNVPFQDVTINDDPAYRDLKLNLHNYFIVKTLDKLKPGGIAALITSRYTLDSSKGSGYRAREEMAKRADLIAAIRLPNSAFKGNARTEVVADLLIFQKRDPSQAIEKMPDWTTVVQHKVGDQTYSINKYIVDNPDHVLGEHSDKGSMYRQNEYTVKPPADFTAALDKATDLIPRNVYGKTGKIKTADISTPPSTLEPEGIQFAPEDVKPGAFFRDDKGQIKIKESGVAKDLPEGMRSKAAQEHLGAAIDLRDQVNRMFAMQLESSNDEPLKAAQAELEKLYKNYVKKYGNTHSPLLAKIFKHDPEYGKLLALENVDTESKEITQSAIFTKRTLSPFEPLRDLPDEPKSAMLKVMAERGFLDTALMADLLKKPEAEVIGSLEKEGLIYQDPQTGAHHPADEYLSGNVREKLKLAEHARESDPRFERNVEELKKVQPKPLTIHEIQPNLGQTWIPMKVYKGFLAHLAGQRNINVNISRDDTGRWLVQVDGNKFKLEHEWQGGGIPGHKLIQYALNQQQPTVYDTDSDGKRHFNAQDTTAARDKLSMIKEEFTTVLRKAEQNVVDELEQIYNDTFNGYKLREFSGEHLDFPGMSEEWRGMIRGYQKASVWRILQEGRGGIFHAPGLGKTLTMATAGMEARRLKLSRKNMYAVPNHMVPQWREDFKRFYPNANVLAVTDDDFTPVNRAQLMSRIATGDWDAVIVPHSQFDLLPMSPEWEKKSIDKRLESYREVLNELDENDDKRTIKQIEKAIDKLESRLNELNAKRKDNTISFDQMGVDMLFVDEAHAYKSMAVPTKMGNIGGISNSASQRAFALEMKANYLRDTHKGRGLVFGTGTPITNTVGELYVMTKYLAPEMLEAAGIRSFDDWAANFAQTVTNWEYAPDGVTFKPKTTLSEFVNVPELSTMFRRYAEYLSKEAARALSNLKEPNATRKDHMATITGAQEPLLDMVAERGDHLIKNPPKTREERMEDNWLKLSGDARKISLDARLYDPDLADEPGSKANQAVKVIKDILDRTSAERGTVAVFSDFFQHKDKAGKVDFNLFEDMKKKLVAQGVPASEVAIIHEVGDDKDKKELLFARVRSGKVRVIFGSTEKMGIGTNIQAKLKGELHLDQPWRPDQVEQREGRIVRSGNMWNDVEIHRFIAEPKEGTVQKYKSDAMTPSARILGKDEAPYDYERVLDLQDDRRLAYKTKDYTEEDAKAAVDAGNLQKMLDSQSQGGIVETERPRAYDLQMYQQLARKANFQEQFLTGNYSGRTMEDVGGDVKLNSQMFQLGKAMATGNPDALRKMKVEHDLRTYSMLERNFQVERSKATRELSNAEYHIPLLEKKLQKLQNDASTWNAATKGEDDKDYPGLKVTIGGKTYQGKEGPGSLKEWLDSNPPISSIVETPITVGGLSTQITTRDARWLHEKDKTVSVVPIFSYRLFGEPFDVPVNMKSDEYEPPAVRSFINSFAARARGIDSSIRNLEWDIKRQQEHVSSLTEDLKRTSPYTVKVEGMEKELAELNKRLGIHGPGDVDEGAAPSEEPDKEKPAKSGEKPENLITGESGSLNISALNPARLKSLYKDFIDKAIDRPLDIGDKYRRVADHDQTIAKALKEKDNAPRYVHDKAESNVAQVTKGLSEDQVRLAAMMSDNQIREYLEENQPEQFKQAQNDPAVMQAVQKFKPYQDQLAAIRVGLGWHVRRDLSIFEDEAGKWKILDPDGIEVEGEEFKTAKAAQDYVEENGQILDHLKRTYPEHLREGLMGRTDEGPSLGATYGGIKPPRPDKKQRIATAEYFYQHGAKDFGGYIKSFTQAYHAALNQKIYDALTDEGTPWKIGTAMPPQIEYRGKTYYSPDVAKSMKLALPENRPKQILEYRAYDPAKDDRTLIKDFENGWSTQTTGRPGISPSDRWLAPAEVVDALERYDMTRGVKENDSIRRFFQDQIVGLFGPTVHVFNIMRRLATTVGSGVWDPRVWPYYQKLFFSKELRERLANGLADDTIDYLSKYGSYTNARDIGSMHQYFLGNLNPANWARQTIGKVSKGVLFDPKFLGGFGGLDQKARVLAADFLHETQGWSEEETSKNVEDGFGNYNKANWTERMKRWARALLFPGWDFSSLKWFLRHPLKTAFLPATVTLGVNLAINAAGKNKDGDKYDFAYIHYGDRKYRTGLLTESMAMHIAEPLLEAGKAALEGGDARDIAGAAGQGVLRGGGGLAGNFRPDIQAAAEFLSNRQYMGGEKEIWRPEDRNIPGKIAPTRQLDKMLAFTVVKAFPAVSRFLDSSYENVDLATGAGSIIGVTNYRSGAEERLKANEAKAMGYSQTLSKLAETEPASAEQFVQDPNKAVYLMFNKDFSELGKDLKEIDTQIERVRISDLPSGERQKALESLKDSRVQLLNAADAISDQLTTAKLQMRKQ